MVSPLSSLGQNDIDLPNTSALKSNHQPSVPGISFAELLRAAMITQQPFPEPKAPPATTHTGDSQLAQLLIASGGTSNNTNANSQQRPQQQPGAKPRKKKAA